MNKVLFLDIETRPAAVYVWKLWDVRNISLDQVISAGGLLCFGSKWGDSKESEFYSEWEHGTKEMLRQAHRLISEADAIVTYNGDRFDLPKLMGEFLQQKMTPPPPPTSIDVFKTVRKLGLLSGKLAFVGPMLKLGDKVKHEGFSLWTKVMAGDEKAQKRMTQYCLQDVFLLEKVYDQIKPFIKNHPHIGEGAGECGACGSRKTQSRGYRRTKFFKIQRLQCQKCGAWSDGKREGIKLAA